MSLLSFSSDAYSNLKLVLASFGGVGGNAS